MHDLQRLAHEFLIPGDFRAGVYTLPILTAFESDRGEELRRLLDGEVDEEVSSAASHIVRSTNGIEHALSIALDHEAEAVAALDADPEEASSSSSCVSLIQECALSMQQNANRQSALDALLFGLRNLR